MTRIVFTIDTEVAGREPSPEDIDAQLYGRLADGEARGFEHVLARLGRHGWGATLFVDVFGVERMGADVGPTLVRRAREAGGDVQLHTHVEHLDGALRARHMSDLQPEAQRQVIERGAGLLRAWGAPSPSWHRAGHLGANTDTLRACQAAGGLADSSLAYGWSACRKLPVSEERRNELQEIDGTRLLPITTFRTLPLVRNFHQMDVNACVFHELATVTRQAVAARVPYLVVLMHSFSFVRRGARGYEVRARDLRRFERYVELLATTRDLEVVTLADLAGARPASPAAAPVELRSGILPTYKRAVVQWRHGRKQKLMALSPVAPLAAAAAAWWLVS